MYFLNVIIFARVYYIGTAKVYHMIILFYKEIKNGEHISSFLSSSSQLGQLIIDITLSGQKAG